MSDVRQEADIALAESGAENVPRTVRGTFNYLADPFNVNPKRKLHYYADMSGSSNIAFAPFTTDVADARREAVPPSLDVEGFTIVNSPTRLTAQDAQAFDPRLFSDGEPGAAGPAYMRECEELVRRLTGATVTMGVGPACRFGDPTPGQDRYDNRTVHWVHADYSDEASYWFFDLFPVDVHAYRRCAIFNIWRVLTPPPQDMPLAVADARSIGSDDEVESIVIMKPPGEKPYHTMTAVYHPSERHRWYYYRDMVPDEALVFVGFDSDPARPHRVPHSAFVDASCPAGTPPRSSVEARVMALFE